MKESTLEEDPIAGMLKRILGGKVQDKTIEKYRKLKMCKRKRKYRNVERNTRTKTIFSGEIGRTANAQER